jgi:hypothetical protein
MKKVITLIAILLLTGCATPRSNSIFGLNFSDMPPRAFIRGQCNGKNFTTQGIMVCESGPIQNESQILVKIPPLQGRVVYSNGQFKKTDDFNWYPKEGFLFWKKKPIKDTWAPLDLGEIRQVFGDWPIALDIAGLSKVGIINTRGIIYYRICNDKDVLCSYLHVNYLCQGISKKTSDNEIGKCDRMSGSEQEFSVDLVGPTYKATTGGRLYISAPRSGFLKTIELSSKEIAAGKISFSIPSISAGPTIVGFRLAYYNEKAELKTVETKVLLVGTSPEWTGLDSPHYLDKGSKIRFVQPILSDQMELNRYNPDKSVDDKSFTTDTELDFEKPKNSQVVCAFAWQRDNSDLTAVCLDKNMNEVKMP